MVSNAEPTVIALVGDLIFSQKIRSAAEGLGRPYLRVRSMEQLSAALEQHAKIEVFVDLGIKDLDPFQALTRASEHSACKKLVGFYSHVDAATGERARTVPNCVVVTRGRLSGHLSELLASTDLAPTRGEGEDERKDE